MTARVPSNDWRRCGYCGRFISYADTDAGLTRSHCSYGYDGPEDEWMAHERCELHSEAEVSALAAKYGAP